MEIMNQSSGMRWGDQSPFSHAGTTKNRGNSPVFWIFNKIQNSVCRDKSIFIRGERSAERTGVVALEAAVQAGRAAEIGGAAEAGSGIHAGGSVKAGIKRRLRSSRNLRRRGLGIAGNRCGTL